jgi:hypothetical protein
MAFDISDRNANDIFILNAFLFATVTSQCSYTPHIFCGEGKGCVNKQKIKKNWGGAFGVCHVILQATEPQLQL